MKRKTLWLASIAIATMGVAGTALAESNLPATQDENINREPGAEEVTDCHDPADAATTTLPLEAPWVSLALVNAERIGLSAEQVRKLELLRTEFEQRATSQSRTIQTAERALQQLLAAQPVDMQRVNLQVDDIGKLRATLRLRRIETVLAGRDLLSTEQQANLQELIAKASTALHRAMMEGIQAQRAPVPTGGSM